MLDLSIDGLLIAKSSGTSLWPILGKIINGPINTPFVIGIYHGDKKPYSVHDYLTSFINEYKRLNSKGFVVDSKRFIVTIRCIIYDSPARSYVKCTKQFNGYFSCGMCTEEGDFMDRMVFLSESAPLRTNETFKCKTNEEHHTGISPFEALPIDMVTQFPLDYMHLVCLRVMKMLLTMWFHRRRILTLRAETVQQLHRPTKLRVLKDTKSRVVISYVILVAESESVSEKCPSPQVFKINEVIWAKNSDICHFQGVTMAD
jgi:hypothetical protein